MSNDIKRVRTSYSQISTYKECPQHWSWRYEHKYSSPEEGSSLKFGGAVDNAVMAMLEKKDNYLEIFHEKWFSVEYKGVVEQVFDNPNITFSYNDFDSDILLQDDLDTMGLWAKELGLKVETDVIDLFKQISKGKKNKFKPLTKKQLTYFNRCNWISLNRKGPILIESFKKHFLPKIKKVHTTQRFGNIKSPSTGHSFMGALDFVADIEGYDKPVILDLKTAARPYTDDQLKFSEQLPLYAQMFGEDYKTDLVGYVILCKNINKVRTAYCKSCGNDKSSRHKTCDNVVSKERCGGEWEEKLVLDPQVQVIITDKSQEERYRLMREYVNVAEAMSQSLIYRNTSKCTNWYGGVCPFFDACHNDDTSNLKKRY